MSSTAEGRDTNDAIARRAAPVCKRCGSTEFVQVGEVEISTTFTRKVLDVGWGPPDAAKAKDKVTRKLGYREDDDAREALDNALDSPDHSWYSCRRCDATADELAELVIVMPTAGVKINLPDGRTRAASRVYIGHWKTGDEYPPDAKLDSSARITVAFHDGSATETFALEDVELWQPNPDQLDLLEAA